MRVAAASASPKRQQPCAQEVNEVSLQPAALCSPNSSASSSQGPSDKNKDSAESVAAARGVHTPQVSSKAEPPPAAAESNDSSPQRHLQEAEDKPNEPENILRCQGARQHEDHPVEQSLPFNASNCQQEVINPEDSRPEGHSCFQTRETNMCVSPELIFGKQSPCLWPLLTGGPKWSQSHQTRKIPLAPFIRQNRGTSEESTNSSAAAIHCKSLPRPGKHTWCKVVVTHACIWHVCVLHACIWVVMCLGILFCVCVYACIWVSRHAFIYACIYIYACTYTCACSYISACMSAGLYFYVQVSMYLKPRNEVYVPAE